MLLVQIVLFGSIAFATIGLIAACLAEGKGKY
jgi:hypothetical protein